MKELLPAGRLPGLLPAGTYRFANAPHDARLAALAFALGAYRFTRYRKAEVRNVRLVLPDGVDGDDLTRIAEGVTLARDLINTPANDMGPGRTGSRRPRARQAARREIPRHRRRRSAEAELSAHSRRRPRRRSAARRG